VTAASREHFAALVRDEPVDLAAAVLLVGVETEPDLDVTAAEASLQSLADAVPAGVAGEPASVSAARLREVLHTFEGSRDEYADLRSSLLHEVLRRRRGLPILLSVLWVEVGRRCGIAVYPIGTPGHFLAGVGDPYGDHMLVDPYRGGAEVSWSEAERLVVEASGIALVPRHLDPAGSLEVLMRVLTNIRVLMAGEKPTLDHLLTRLWAVDLSLLLPRHPVDLRRERAELLTEFERFADAVEGANAEGAAAARSAAKVSRARCN
jgi:regulator of sirC expression with transglutaminase-like and TPR domain